MTACPSGCGRGVKPGQLMCGFCWREVPRHLQREVNATWRRYRAVPSGLDPVTNARRRAARLDYQAARDAALASIK